MAKRREDLGMSIEEFLLWDDGTDTRHELDQGHLVAMSPPVVPHGRIAQNIGTEIDRHLTDREPCRALQGAGILISEQDQSFYIPDVVMTCEPPATTPYVQEPRLVVEILSPTTSRLDQEMKVPAYAALPSVQEIWLVSSQRRFIQIWRRTPEGWQSHLPTLGDASFTSPVLAAEIPLERLYRLSGV